MFKITPLTEKFLRKLYNSQDANKEAINIATEVDLPEEEFKKLEEIGWIQKTTFGILGYRVADPILNQLGLPN
jgi:hypothetical protein